MGGVECTFGILKGRCRVLKTGVRLHGTDAVDNVQATCCTLHKWLLDVDGLDEKLEEGVQSLNGSSFLASMIMRT
jgi:hypothetical protein